jgi:hypothetical protein
MHDTTALPEWVLARINVNIDVVRRMGATVIYEETELYTKKWFDYSFLTPTKATELFRIEYSKAYKLSWRTYQDRNEASR